MNNQFVIKMDHNDSIEMEKAWYEYNASLSIIRELMKDSDVDFNILQEYIDVAEKRWFFAEQKKQKFGEKYIPAGNNLGEFNFSFDFENENLIFEQVLNLN